MKLSAVWIFLILSFTQTQQVLLSRDWYSTHIEQKPVRSGFGETMKEKKPPAFCGLVLACPFHSAANDECPETTHTIFQIQTIPVEGITVEFFLM